MCLIIVKEVGEPLTKEFYKVAKEGMEWNRDGVGFAIRRDSGEIEFRRGLYTSSDILATIERMGVTPLDTLVFHARACTKGSKSVDNCHPFPAFKFEDWYKHSNIGSNTLHGIGTKHAMIFHNGGFPISANTEADKNKSDTYLFSRDFVCQFDLLNSKAGERAISTYINKIVPYNRVCVLHPTKGLQYYGDFYKDNLFNLVLSQKRQNTPAQFVIRTVDGVPKERDPYCNTTCL
jgi:hypothetical protein